MKIAQMVAMTAACMLLGGCASGFGTRQILREKQYTQYNVPEEKFPCSMIKSLPKPQGVTDAQIAKLMARLYHDNQECYFSMESLKEYLRKADAEGSIHLTPAFLKSML